MDNLSDIKTRLSGEVDWYAWRDLCSYATENGWLGAHSDKICKVFHTAWFYVDPDLLIPVALSMVPEGWFYEIASPDEGDDFAWGKIGKDDDYGFGCYAPYPAAALALAVIEART